MIKLQDFARECGVTDRAIQKHLKTHAAELEGLYQRRGPNGTWLSEEACQILRGKMKQQPVVVGDTAAYDELERLRTEHSTLKDKYIVAMEEIASTRAALAEAKSTQRLLEASESAREAERAAYEAKVAREAQKAAEAAQRAQKAIEEAGQAKKALEEYMALPFWKKILKK